MQILDIIFRERSGYRDMHLRPFSTDASSENINLLDEYTNGGRDISPSAVSRVSGRMIRPAANTEGRAFIANSWGEKRLMFIMSVLVRDAKTAKTIYEISGYTDHMGAIDTIKGVKLDNRMALYFNSVTRVNRMLYHDGNRTGWQDRIIGSEHIIAPQIESNFELGGTPYGTMTMRPHDIFHSDPKDVIARSFNRHTERDGQYYDMRYGVPSGNLKLSERLNDSSSQYLSRSFRALHTAKNGEAFNREMDPEPSSVLRDARGQLAERSFSQDQLFTEMARDTNIMDQGFLTYGELVEMNQDFDWESVRVYFEPPNTMNASFRDTSDWNGRDNTTIAALQIARALPAYMAFHEIAAISFQATNHAWGGKPVVLIPSALPVLGKRVSDHALTAFEDRLKTELFHDMLPWDDCMFEITVVASISDEIRITISLEGEDPAELVYPVFCDNLVSPIMTDNIETVREMGITLATISDQIGAASSYNDGDTESPYRPSSPSSNKLKF